MLAVLAQGIVVVIRSLRVEGGVDGGDAGVSDGRGGEPRVGVEVIGGVHLLVGVGEGPLVVRQGVEQSGVDVQHLIGAVAAAVVEAVIDDGGDLGVVRAVGLLLDEGGDGDDLLQAVAGLLHRLHPLLGHLAVEVVQQALDGGGGLLVQVELIGVREEVALQPGELAGILDEVIGEAGGLGGLGQGLLRVDALAGQERQGLLDGVALGDGDLHHVGVQVAGGVVHGRDQGQVVHVLVEGIGADADLALGVAEAAHQLEKPGVVDEAVGFQLLRDAGEIILRRDLHLRLHRRPVERAELADHQPAAARQDGGDHQHEEKVRDEPHPSAALLPGTVLLRPADFPGVPAGGVLLVISWHSKPPVPGRERLPFRALNFREQGDFPGFPSPFAGSGSPSRPPA